MLCVCTATHSCISCPFCNGDGYKAETRSLEADTLWIKHLKQLNSICGFKRFFFLTLSSPYPITKSQHMMLTCVYNCFHISYLLNTRHILLTPFLSSILFQKFLLHGSGGLYLCSVSVSVSLLHVCL